MRLTVTDCVVRPNGQWTVTFEVTGDGTAPEPAIVVMHADPAENVDKLLAMAAAKVRDHAPKWDGVSRVASVKAAIGKAFDVTLASVKEVVAEEKSL